MTRYRPLHETDPRYSQNWAENSRYGRGTTNHICCYCFCRKARELHHTRYLVPAVWGKPKPVKLDERGYVGRFLFPLCIDCHHGIMHSFSNWVVKSKDGWQNHQVTAMEMQLQARYAVLRVLVVTWFVWMPLLAGVAAYGVGLMLKFAN